MSISLFLPDDAENSLQYIKNLKSFMAWHFVSTWFNCTKWHKPVCTKSVKVPRRCAIVKLFFFTGFKLFYQWIPSLQYLFSLLSACLTYPHGYTKRIYDECILFFFLLRELEVEIFKRYCWPVPTVWIQQFAILDVYLLKLSLIWTTTLFRGTIEHKVLFRAASRSLLYRLLWWDLSHLPLLDSTTSTLHPVPL